MSDQTKPLIKALWTDEAGECTELELPVGRPYPLLDLCEDEGLNLPHGCRSGSCGSCRVKIIEGGELLSERSFVEKDTLERHHDTPDIRLACRAELIANPNAQTKRLVFQPAPEAIFED